MRRQPSRLAISLGDDSDGSGARRRRGVGGGGVTAARHRDTLAVALGVIAFLALVGLIGVRRLAAPDETEVVVVPAGRDTAASVAAAAAASADAAAADGRVAPLPQGLELPPPPPRQADGVVHHMTEEQAGGDKAGGGGEEVKDGQRGTSGFERRGRRVDRPPPPMKSPVRSGPPAIASGRTMR